MRFSDFVEFIVVGSFVGGLILIVIANALFASTSPPKHGMIELVVCSLTRGAAHDGERILVSPQSVMTISNPKDSPKDCVKLVNAFGNSVYVYGTMEGLAAARLAAIREFQ